MSARFASFRAAFSKDLSRRLADWTSLAIWITIPLAMGFLLKLTFGGPSGGTPRAKLLICLEQNEGLLPWLLENAVDGSAGGPPVVLEIVDSEAEGLARIESNEASAFLALPNSFLLDLIDGEAHEFELVTNPARSFSPQLIEDTLALLIEASFRMQNWLGPGLDSFRRELVSATEEGRAPNTFAIAAFAGLVQGRMEEADQLLFPPVLQLALEDEPDADAPPELSFTELFFPSLLLLSLLFLGSGLSEDLWAEKSGGTLRRSLSLPHGGLGLVLGKLASCGLLLGLVALSGVLVARFVFRIDLDQPVAGALWATLAALAGTSVLFAVQTFTKTQRASSLVANLVILPVAMLGGCFFPFEAMPSGLAEIGRVTPAGWALTRLRELFSEPVALSQFAAPAGLLVSVGALGVFVTLRRIEGPFGFGGES